MDKGNASFIWDGKGNDGTQWPEGTYTMTATCKDSAGKDVAIPTEVLGVVDSVDLTASPAAAFDRRQELHDRPDQAGDPPDDNFAAKPPSPARLTLLLIRNRAARHPPDGGRYGISKEILY